MFKIGDFSKLAQVSVKTLRFYDQIKLLQPAWIDRYSGYRYYTLAQLPRLNRILALKDLGFSLEQIQKLLREDLPAAELRGMMRMKQAEIERQIEAEQFRLARVEARLRQIEHEGMMPVYEIVLKDTPSQQVVGLRRVLDSYQSVLMLFGELYQAMDSKKPFAASQPATFTNIPALAIYYDADYRDRQIDVEAAMSLSGNVKVRPSHLLVHELAGSEVASTIYQGPHEELAEVYQATLAWTEQNGYRICGPVRNVYWQGVPDASENSWVTEVQFPVEKKPIPIFVHDRKEKQPMEVKIVTRPAFDVVGLSYYGKNQNQEIKAVWGVFNQRMAEIQHVVDGAFGVCGESESDGAFKYVAGMAVSNYDAIPEDMVVWNVPEQQYAVFPTTLPAIGETYRYAFETWLPQSGYEYTKGPDFEYYDENFDPETEDSIFHIYIPIK